MGKDKKDKKGLGDIGSFKTKDTLKEEDIELTKVVNDLSRRYKDLYKHVEALSGAYGHCKEHFAVTRYGELKRMIKACISDEVMQKAAKYSAAQAPQEQGKSVSLLRAAKALSSGATEAASAMDEVAGLHKAEIVEDIEQKKKTKDKVEKKFLRLHNRLVKLQRDYEESKVHIPTKRYMVMKEMIKPIIRDEILNPDK